VDVRQHVRRELHNVAAGGADAGVCLIARH
jgi:hypothetical protein